MMIIKFLFEFFKIGALTYGGGLAMIPLLSDFATSNGWITSRDFADLIAISQSTPGPIAINMATFIGFKTYGIAGAILASFFVVVPGWILVILVSKFLNHFDENTVVKATLNGLKVSVIGLLGLAIFEVGRVTFFNVTSGEVTFSMLDLKSVLFFVIGYFFIKHTKYHAIVYLCIGGILGTFLW